MTTHKDAENGTHLLTTKPDAMVGAGRLAAGLWKNRNGQVDYDFNVFRVDRTTGDVTQRFQSGDLPDLARLAQLLAAEISRDEALGDETCDDLACLASCLEDVLPTGFVFSGIRCTHEGPAFRAIVVLLMHLWDTAGEDFVARPQNQHIYRVLVVLDAWLRGVGPASGIVLPDVEPEQIEDYFGGCPLCGSNDGYVNLRSAHWFRCEEHQLRWCAGENLFSTWRNENQGDWNENFRKVGSFREVYPMLNPNERSSDS